MSGRRITRQTPAQRRRVVAVRAGRLCTSCGTRHEPPTSLLCPALMSPIEDDVLNTQLGTTGNSVPSNLLASSPVFPNDARTGGIPPVQYVSTDDRLNMLINLFRPGNEHV